MDLMVRCTSVDDGHSCEVQVAEGTSATRHTVRVTARDLGRWGAGRSAEDLVRRSFDFLLARGPKESILREFDLSVIQRYFPEYESAIRS